MSLVFTTLDRDVCYTLHRGCSYAVGVYRQHGDVDGFLRPIATYRTHNYV
jgi:hypothetical protein